MAEKSLPSVQEHARTLLEQAAKEGKIDPQSVGLPAFSEGTTNTPQTAQGAVPEVPTFDQGQVAIPEAPVAPPIQGESAPPPPAEPQPQAQAQAQAQAADAVAQQIEDDWEEFEVEEPDFPDIKIPIKTKKQYAQIMKRAIPRRADYDRTRARWADAAPVLEPLIKDGRIKQVLPLMQRAFEDQEFGDFVVRAYQRRSAGLPMLEQAIQEAAQAGRQAQMTDPQQTYDIQDPYIAENIRPVFSRLQEFEQKFQTLEQQQAEAQRRQQDEYQRNVALANEMAAAHRDLENRYPGVFNASLGPNDPAWQQAVRNARDYGYTDTYGFRAGIVFGGDAWQALERERQAATASPAAQMLQNMDQRNVALAAQEAARAAATVAGGTTAQSTPAPPPPRPSTRNPDGTMKPPDQFSREMNQWLMATGQLRTS